MWSGAGGVGLGVIRVGGESGVEAVGVVVM